MKDIINGLFEAFGSVAVFLSCLRLIKDKQVKGISVMTVIFFTSWGFWNMFYYPSLGQMFSSLAAVSVCLMNSFWVFLLIKYRGRK